MAAIYELGSTTVLNPTPGFVVKTKIVEGKGDHLYSTKVFINVCHDAQVPKPKIDFDAAIVFPLIVDNEWEIPIIVSPEKKDSDKKGVPSFVYDCCMNTECFQWLQINKDLKLITVEWCIEAVELMHELVLEREYTTPKMLLKGELSHTEISGEGGFLGLQNRLQELKQNETLGLIQALEPEAGIDDDTDELPDLMNISGAKSRPLIQEISDMSIEDLADSNTHEVEGKLQQLWPAKQETTNLIEHLKSKPTPYEFSVTPCTRENHFYIKFESPQLTPMLEVTHHNQCIRITNTDATRTLTRENRIDIPIPGNAVPYQSFIVQKTQALFVFCHLR